MSDHMPKCKITIISRKIEQELINEYLVDKYQSLGLCDIFSDGQEFVLEKWGDLYEVPEGFCASAWADIRKDILLIASGGNMHGIKQPGKLITSCRDWFRPVLFKVERIQES